MNLNFLAFEQPIAELEAKIEELRLVTNDTNVNITDEIKRLQQKSNELTKSIFSSLSSWQVAQLARHPQRPQTLDYIEKIFTDFDELHGDRHYTDSQAIVGGMANFNNEAVMVIGHQRGRGTKEKLACNFGMAQPEGYRKALRLMKMAERFQLPLITFIDTMGAYPGISAEEHNQSEAIARNLAEMAELQIPVICVVIGEGGSGGAIALGVGDRLLMLQYSIYSVITPEGCASILWKNTAKAADAAEALGITADKILKLGLVDEVIPEPLGGAHRNLDEISQNLKNSLQKHLTQIKNKSIETLMTERYDRLTKFIR
jgi:acetyl-CoA carboxylase carboxyl transferase subunit alpha